MTKCVAILLSTFNGEKYLKEQIESIIFQTYTNWHLYIRDDCSSDTTLSIINHFKNTSSSKITLLPRFEFNIGVVNSFEKLLIKCSEDYIMFCDQDDIWNSNKIEVTLNKILEIEKKNPNIPILVCSDLILVDEHLNLIDESMWDYIKINPFLKNNLYTLAINNFVTGCTVMINSKAKLVSIPFSTNAVIHDWWIALSVYKVGIIEPIADKTIMYRQHNSNVYGANKIGSSYFVKKMLSIKKLFNGNKALFLMLREIEPSARLTVFIYFKIKISFLRVLKSLFS